MLSVRVGRISAGGRGNFYLYGAYVSERALLGYARRIVSCRAFEFRPFYRNDEKIKFCSEKSYLQKHAKQFALRVFLRR